MRSRKNMCRMTAGIGGLLAAITLSIFAHAQADYEGRFGVFHVQPQPPQSSLQTNSSHPAMTPAAIEAARVNFPACIELLWPQAARRKISRRTFDVATHGLQPDMKIMELLDKQPEFTRPVWAYLDDLVSDSRIATGRVAIAQNRAVFDAVEKVYGVDRYILTAIWGIEFELRPARRRAAGRSVDGDACLHRASAELFSRRIPDRARNHRPWRRAGGADERILGGRVRANAIHADGVQALRGRF